MNYFSRPREDGKWDVLEGTEDSPGRIVTCFDTQEDAAAYIAEQSAIFDELFDRITSYEDDERLKEDNVLKELTTATDPLVAIGWRWDLLKNVVHDEHVVKLINQMADSDDEDQPAHATDPSSDEHLNHMADTFDALSTDEHNAPEYAEVFQSISAQLRGATKTPDGSPDRQKLANIMTSPTVANDEAIRRAADTIGPKYHHYPTVYGTQADASLNVLLAIGWRWGVLLNNFTHMDHVERLARSLGAGPSMASHGPEDARPAAESSEGSAVHASISATTSNGVSVIPSPLTVTAFTVNGLPLVAHAEPPTPPATFFTEPPPEFQRRYTTVTDDGRVMGLLATFDECHVGYGNQCITAPREADYSHFAVGTVLTSDGTTIPTGVIAIKGGHADIGLDAASARSHYDDTNSGIVDVAVGVSDPGVWFSGALRPGATPAQVQALRASGVSGDWRLIDGQLRLIGICTVNVPGFPKLSVAASATELTALVAAGGPPEPHPDLCGCKDSTQDILEELDYLHKIVADAGLEDAALEKLAARILTDDDIDTLYERVIQEA